MSEMISIAAFKAQRPFDNVIRRYSLWRKRVDTVKALNQLSARQLNDVGIMRADIDRVAKRMR